MMGWRRRTESSASTKARWLGPILLAACGAPAPHTSATPAKMTVAAAAPAPAPAPSSASAAPALTSATRPACPPLDEAKIKPPSCDDAILSTPIPPIEDGTHALRTFYESYAAIARGRVPPSSHVRMAMYGDSNLTMDELTGRLRRELQRRFGDAGHGYVALALPWHWYEHQDVHHFGKWDQFRQIATSTHPIGDQHYGLANMAAESTRAGASVWVKTADVGAPIGTKVSRADVFFLKRPQGGDFEIAVDGASVRTVSTRSASSLGSGAYDLGVEHLDLSDGPHEITCTAKSAAPVRFFGITLERGEGSVVVDSLGVSALNFAQLRFTKPETRRAMFAKRDYKLVIFQIGTNTFALDTHEEDAKRILTELRETLPGVSILLMSPPDAMNDWNDPHSDKRIVTVTKQLREIAKGAGVAFWDYREAMGGDTSIRTFIRKGLAAGDRIHFKKEGSELMADRFLCAVEKDFRAWLADHPNAGCAE